MLLLTAVGVKSEQESTVVLRYFRDGERLLVVASASGSPQHSAWYHDLLANPMALVEVGTDDHWMVAVPAEDEEHRLVFCQALQSHHEGEDAIEAHLAYEEELLIPTLSGIPLPLTVDSAS